MSVAIEASLFVLLALLLILIALAVVALFGRGR